MTEVRQRTTMHRHRATQFGVALALGLSAAGCGTSPDAPIVPTQLVLTTNAAGAVSGLVFTTQPEVAVHDAAGTTVTSYNRVVTMSVSAGLTVFGSSSAAASRGIARSSGAGITGPVGASYTLSFTSGALSPATQSIALPLSFVAIKAGSFHSCALTSAGAAYCWGLNGDGQLGDGATSTRLVPEMAQGGTSFTSITAGAYHTCGLNSAGAAHCWGFVDAGGLGDGTTLARLTPVAVVGGHVFTEMTAGGYHTCGRTSASAAYCWGGNAVGELGDGTLSRRTIPTPVQGGRVFTVLAAGGFHSCGLTGVGVAYCWGTHAYGEAGDGTTPYRLVPVGVGRP